MNTYLKIIIIALASYIVTPLRALHSLNASGFYLSTFLHSIVCFVLTVYLLKVYSNKLKPWKIVSVFLLVVLLPDIWVDVIAGHYMTAVTSLPDWLLRILVILLAWYYFKLSKVRKTILASVVLLICIWTSSFGITLWWNTCNEIGLLKQDKISLAQIVDCLDLAYEKNINVENLKGKAVILYFWEMDDPKSIKQLPLLQQMYDSLKNRNDVAVLAVQCYDKVDNDMMANRLLFLQKNNFNFPSLSMNKEKYKFGIKYLPSVFYINKNGDVISKSGGTVLRGATGLTESKDLSKLDKFVDYLNE